MNEQATHTTVNALLRSILVGPLLVGDLPEAKCFCRSNLRQPEAVPNLNLQQKLGHLFEDALASLLVASNQVELLEKNLQLRDEARRTVGEMDFLVRELSNNALIHLELATKFYLAVETPSGIALPGPDARDNYFRKLARLRDHQLRLPIRFLSCLPPAYKSTPIMTQQLIYGCLFDHVDTAETFTPEFTPGNCRRGKWLHEQDCERHFGPDSKFEIIPKALWPVPFELLKDLDLEPWTPSKPIERCLMVRANWESTPYFVAPTGYPNQTASFQVTIPQQHSLIRSRVEYDTVELNEDKPV